MLKKYVHGFGAVGSPGVLSPEIFTWADWVTTVLLWTLMIVAILAIVQHVSKDK